MAAVVVAVAMLGVEIVMLMWVKEDKAETRMVVKADAKAVEVVAAGESAWKEKSVDDKAVA